MAWDRKLCLEGIDMKKHTIFAVIGSVAFLLLGVALVLFYSVRAWEIFLSICPNHDFLSWDENIRLNTVLDQYTDFRDGRFLKGILPFFESPTWPPLRSVLTFITLYLPIDSPETFRDSFLGLFFLILVYPALVFVLHRILGSLLYSSIISFLVFLLTIQTGEVPAYSLSSMLETQSMFFLLISVYAIYRMYDEENKLEEGGDEEASKNLSSSTKWLLSFALLGFYFTKYPYGILFFMGCIFYEIVRNPNKYWSASQILLKIYLKGARIFYLGFVFLMVLSLPVLRLFSSINLNQKGFKQFMFAITFLLFVDVSIFFYRKRNQMKEIFPRTVIVLWKFAIFPAFVWLFLNPDRVNALIDAQMIVNAYTRSFFLTLWTEPGQNVSVPGVFDFVWGFRALVIFSIVSLLYFLLRSKVSISKKMKDPLFAASLVLFLQLLILELTTGNKQPRHVLQFLPSMGAVFFIWNLRLLEYAKSNLETIAAGFAIGVSILFVSVNGFFEQGIFNNQFFEKKMFCYRGMDKTIFDPAREISEQLVSDKKYVLINAFHFEEKYQTKGRLIASDFDLAMKLKTYKLGLVRNDNKYHWKDWTKFDSVLLLSDTCPDSFVEEKFEIRTKMLNAKSTLLSTYRESTGTACLQEYKLLHE